MKQTRHWPWLWWPTARHLHLALVTLLVAWAALECFGPLPSKSIAAATFDLMQRHRLWASRPDPRLLIVDIDERSLAEMSNEFGRWPWSRDTLATVLDAAQAQQARAVVFDILFSDPDRLRPGGDQALDAAVRAGRASFFEVVRLPARNDPRSELTLDRVPGLAAAPPAAAASAAAVPGPRVALILPFMQSMLASGRLGTNTVRLDEDGKLRRFAWVERLQGWSLLSMPMAVARGEGVPIDASGEAHLAVWRQQPDAYPRLPFWQVFACEDKRAAPSAQCPSLAGKILIVGVTATSLHDIMSSPLIANHAGVDILATLIDNAIHHRWYREPGPLLRFGLALAALALAWQATRRRAAGATQIALLALPLALVTIGYASLHTEWLYLDLMLPAGIALTFLSAVKLIDTCRRHVFGLSERPAAGCFALAVGSVVACAEQLERQVFDVAARRKLEVSGGVHSAGAWGRGDAGWVIWGLTATDAEAIGAALRRAIPAAWVTRFAVGDDPERDRHAALAALGTRDASPIEAPGEHRDDLA